jgi:hypothetical protein
MDEEKERRREWWLVNMMGRRKANVPKEDGRGIKGGWGEKKWKKGEKYNRNNDGRVSETMKVKRNGKENKNGEQGQKKGWKEKRQRVLMSGWREQSECAERAAGKNYGDGHIVGCTAIGWQQPRYRAWGAQ